MYIWLHVSKLVVLRVTHYVVRNIHANRLTLDGRRSRTLGRISKFKVPVERRDPDLSFDTQKSSQRPILWPQQPGKNPLDLVASFRSSNFLENCLTLTGRSSLTLGRISKFKVPVER